MEKLFLKKNKFTAGLAIFLSFVMPTASLYAAESSSTNYQIIDSTLGSGQQMNSTNFSVTGVFSQSSFGSWVSGSLPLLPGIITSCGQITTSGTYTLGTNITGISGPCFIIQANNVVINGAGYTVTASTSNSSYAITATSSVANGGSGYGTTTVQNISFVNFGGGINANGNNNVVGAGGNGGNIYVASSTLGSITSTGGSGNSSGNGGAGGAIIISNTNLDLSNKTYSGAALSLLYSGTLTTASTTLGALNHLIINSSDLGSYVGGAFPIIPGNISSCGSIYFAGTYTLTANSTSSCNILNSGAIIAGASGGSQKILNGNVTANNYGVTLSNITVTGAVSTTGATPGAVTVNNASNLQGTVSVTGVLNGDGSSSLGNTTISSGGSVATSSMSFVGDVINNGTINSGNAVAGKTTNNSTINTGVGAFTFNASSTNSGTVNGNAIFSASSTNFLNSSIGAVTGNATFKSLLVDSNNNVSFGGTASFSGIGVVNGNVYDASSTQINTWTFNASSTNTGIIKGNAIFNDNSTNTGNITGNADVYSPVTRPLGGTASGQVVYHNYAGMYFNDTAAGHGVTGKWNDLNNWWLNVGATVHSPVLPTSGDDVIILSGNITSDTAGTAYANSATFQSTSSNGITINVSSTSTSAALFTASSTNAVGGIIVGNATFSGPGTDNLGAVTGYITRQYASPVVVVGAILHNFTYLTVQAVSGAVVDLSSATYNLTNYFFQALSNAVFIWNNASGAGAPNLSITTTTTEGNAKWSPSISWGTAALCQYKLDSGTYASVSCSNNGTDIPRPSAGFHTLYVKSTSGSNYTEKFATFTYNNALPVSTDCSAPLDEATRPYYYLTSNVGNCTITASTTLRGDNNNGGLFFTVSNITGSSTDISLVNVTATGAVSNFRNISVASSTLAGGADIAGNFGADSKSTIGTSTVESGGVVTSGVFTGSLLNKVGGIISNSTSTPVTVAGNVTNNGTINGGFTFNIYSSTNNGIINGDLTFGQITSQSGQALISGTSVFSGTGNVTGALKDSVGNVITSWLFKDASANSGFTRGTAFFDNSSINSGIISGNAYFSDSSSNIGTTTGNADVYYSVATPLTGHIGGTITYHSYPNTVSFNNVAGDNDWNNPANWFTDTTFNIPLGQVPDPNQSVVLFASTTLPNDINGDVFVAVNDITIDGAGHTINGNVSGNGAYGGNSGFNFNEFNIGIIGTTTSNGTDGLNGGSGGAGGNLVVSTSTTGAVVSNGASGSGNGGRGGAITIISSLGAYLDAVIVANGGNSVSCGNGGDAGDIILINSTYNGINANPGTWSNTGCPGTSHQSGKSSTPNIIGTYVPPSHYANPSSRAGWSNPVVGNWALTPGTNNLPSITPLKPLYLKPLPAFVPNVSPNPGLTQLFNPLAGLLPPGAFKFNKTITSFNIPVSNFLFSPLRVPVYYASIKNGLLTMFVGVDAEKNATELIKVQGGTPITVTLVTSGSPIKGNVTGTFQNKPAVFVKIRNQISTNITAPTIPGTYILKTSVSPVTLSIQVLPVPKAQPANNPLTSIWSKIKTLWNKVF